uniref:C-type lectin domain-containing protein n=1 Tax=Panagrolaimus superbus TaxID=310955 RepID=A0A914ZA99_9BILA
MVSPTFFFSFILLCLPLTSGKELCKNGEKIFMENLIYDCVEGNKVYYGCMINGVEIKQNTTKDENNLRRHFCYKHLNDVKTDIIIGCVTDDNIFINETKTVRQSDGSNFTCTKHGRGFTFTKEAPSNNSGCHLGKTKVISDRFLLECQNKNRTHNIYKLVACYPNRGNYGIRVEAKNTYDEIVNKYKGFGFRYQCHAKGNQYFYDLVGCLVGKELVKPDDIFVNETVAVFCLQEGPDKLRLKPFIHNKFVGKTNCTNDDSFKSFKASKKSVVKRTSFSSLFKTANAETLKKCSETWTYNDQTGFCYKTFNSTSNWDAAKKRCEVENSTLTSVHNLQEAQFIANLSYSLDAETWFWKPQSWIGLHYTDKNVGWKWVDNTPFNYGKWSVNEPDDMGRQRCGYIRLTASSTVMVADIGDFQNTNCDEILSKCVCKKASL